MNRGFYIGLLTLALAACSVDDKVADYGDVVSLKSNQFTYGTESYEWEFGDKVGVSIYDSSASAIVENVAYANTAQSGATAIFSAVNNSETLNWEGVGSKGLYTVYAPYSSEVVDSKLSLDLSNQANQSSIDLVAATGSLAQIEEGLDFEHLLAVVNFEITANNDFTLAQLYNLTYTMGGVVTSGTYNLLSNHISLESETAEVVGMALEGDNNSVTVSVIVLPQSVSTVVLNFDASLVADLEDGFVGGVVEGGTIEAGKSYNFNVDISRESATITGSSITNWGDGGSTVVGQLTEDEDFVIEVGDFILYDGTLLKSADWATINPQNPAVGVFYIASEEEGGSYAISVERSGLVQFSTKTTFYPSAVENNDGRIATDYFFHEDYGAQSYDDYPAFKFCHELNKNSDELTEYTDKQGVWYMPSRYEMIPTSGVSVGNTLFTTFSSGAAAIIPDLSGTTKTYSSSTLGTTYAVYTGDYETEESVMTSIYHAGGDPFDNYWVRNADDSENTKWSLDRTKDPATDLTRSQYNELEGFNSIRYSFDRVFDLDTYNGICMYWLSTAVGTASVNAYRVQLTRSSGSGSTYARGPTGEARTNSRQTRCILRY